jgi:CheY-like chemotaxis protein
MSTYDPSQIAGGAMNMEGAGGSSVPPPPRILLVDDNEATQRGLARFLEAEGYEVTLAFDGTTALEVLESGPPPDFVLTDLRLPDLDGRELARSARQLVPPPRVALITGWDLDPDVDSPDAWGIEWYFQKPLNVRDLIEKLREAPRSPAPASSPP